MNWSFSSWSILFYTDTSITMLIGLVLAECDRHFEWVSELLKDNHSFLVRRTSVFFRCSAAECSGKVEDLSDPYLTRGWDKPVLVISLPSRWIGLKMAM